MSNPRMPRARAGNVVGWFVAASLLGACAGPRGSSTVAPSGPEVAPAAGTTTVSPDPDRVFEEAQDALLAGDDARAVVMFGRFLAMDGVDPPKLPHAYLGLARAREHLHDCSAALTAYRAFLQHYPEHERGQEAWAHQGACEAELGEWERSASSFAEVVRLSAGVPSAEVEALARQGYAWFNLGELNRADEVLARADEVFQRAISEDEERFSSHYFAAMARFYRAAVVHQRFREVRIELPEKVMEVGFKRKLDLLRDAQDAYNDTIRVGHLFWVSAAGYQLGHLFGEFHDALMHAPVPEWLDDHQRVIYYQELKKQVRPIFDKAVWVFEKNLETARSFGYSTPFIDRTQALLGQMQSILMSDEPHLGEPLPYLTADETGGPALEGRIASEPLDPEIPVEDAKLFVPPMTTL